MKKIIVFDQDDTLNITKLPIDKTMAILLVRLLEKYEVCIISGTDWNMMKKINIHPLINAGATKKDFSNLHIMPTTGTQYWKYFNDDWKREYALFLSNEQKEIIIKELEKVVKKLGLWCENPKGEIIEDRESQITFSALGQLADSKDKYGWDLNQEKRKKIVELIKPKLENIGVKVGIGGTTSIDITMPGIDKAYGIRQLIKYTNYSINEILFVGDKLQQGGNDYPVKEMGIDTIEVSNNKDTNYVIQGILSIS